MKQITSRTNEEIKQICALHDTKGRQAQKRFIAEGVRTIETLIESGHKPVQLYATESQVRAAKKLVKEYFITQVHDHVMEKLSTLTTPSGLVGVFEIPKQPSLSALTAGLVLAKIADPGNMGTLIRSAAAFGIKTVITIEGADVWSPKVVQASAGTIGAVTLFECSWKDVLRYKKELQLGALVVNGGAHPETVSSENLLLVVGSEAHGIPHDWLAQCEHRLTIPMPGNAESLNAAVAGSIGLYITFVKNK